MDSQSLFLTADCDTIHALTVLHLRRGPLVVDVPSQASGAVADMWFRWLIDMGTPDPVRDVGGKYLILPPGYRGLLPESGYRAAAGRTSFALAFTRYFLENATGNWIQSIPGKGWFTVLRLFSRCRPSSTKAGGQAKFK